MEQLSERVSIERGEGRLSVVISARTSRGSEALLIAWSLAWLLCGVYVMVTRNGLSEEDPLRQYLLAFMAFWLYFAVAIGKALLWRLKGFELWRIKYGTLVVKDSLFGYGKAQNYFVDNIQQLGLLQVDESSWKWQWNRSVWVIGGERLGFDHLGRKVVFGKGLTDEEAARLVPLLKSALKYERRNSGSEVA